MFTVHNATPAKGYVVIFKILHPLKIMTKYKHLKFVQIKFFSHKFYLICKIKYILIEILLLNQMSLNRIASQFVVTNLLL